MDIKCKNCRFFEIGYVEEVRELYTQNIKPHCRRFAPRMLSGSGEGWSGQLFPVVRETDWCGEFSPNEHSEL